jgi:intraflagellar transport protein 20
MSETLYLTTTETDSFNDVLNSFMKTVDIKAKEIEAEKLRAIGLRNKVLSEKDFRKRKQKEMQALVAEKQAELERYR